MMNHRVLLPLQRFGACHKYCGQLVGFFHEIGETFGFHNARVGEQLTSRARRSNLPNLLRQMLPRIARIGYDSTEGTAKLVSKAFQVKSVGEREFAAR